MNKFNQFQNNKRTNPVNIKTQTQLFKRNYNFSSNGKIFYPLRNQNNIEGNYSILDKYINYIIKKFSIRCGLLISQIEEMKREFIGQVEGIHEWCYKENKFPFIKKIQINRDGERDKDKERDIERDKDKERDRENEEMQHNLNRNIENFHVPTEQNSRSFIHDFNGSNTKRNKNINNDEGNINCFHSHSNSNHIFSIKKSSSNLSFHKKPNQIKKIRLITNKENAFGIMLKNNMFNLEEKIKIKYLNKTIYQQTLSITAIKEQFQNFIESGIEKIKDEFENCNIPSMTSISNINFITLEKENEFINEQHEQNKVLYELIYKLCGIKMKAKSSFKNCYEELKAKFKVQSLKELFNKVLLPLLHDLSSIKKAVLEDSINILDKYNNKLNQISNFSFILNEMLSLFKSEILKRKKIQLYEEYLLKAKSKV